MLLRRVYNHNLAQASYLIACEEGGVALVVDPLRDPERYLDAAAEERVTITDVAETHIHADFVSGARDLARAIGATLHLSGMGGSHWQYNVAGDGNLDLLRDGSSFAVGSVRIDVMHTPGHTPEHLTFLVTDTASANVALGALTGDFIFVGDVGRPDLLERALGISGTKEAAARDLFRSLQRFKSLPDYLQLWPGHGAGSACGKALGAMPQSTLGYERLVNWGLTETDENEFVRRVLTGQPEPPAYFALMKAMNREGPPPRKSTSARDIPASELASRLREGATVVDTRPATEFAAAHAEGTINLPYNKSFLTWAGALLAYDRPIYLIALRGGNAGNAIADDLSLIGLDNVEGVCSVESIIDIEKEQIVVASTRQMSIHTLADRTAGNGPLIVDVRAPEEWDEGHIPGALNLPLVSLQSRLTELPRGREIAVHCEGGGRSAIAASILQKSGFSASNVAGGYSEWESSGHPVERDGGDGGGGDGGSDH
jgi:hydroxyacylglutathione hydrolase